LQAFWPPEIGRVSIFLRLHSEAIAVIFEPNGLAICSSVEYEVQNLLENYKFDLKRTFSEQKTCQIISTRFDFVPKEILLRAHAIVNKCFHH
jgi:hypothetical protein